MQPSFSSVLVLTALCAFTFEDVHAWKGNYIRVQRVRYVSHRYCRSSSWWWGCSAWGYSTRPVYYYENQCQSGWTHNGDRDCRIPICRPSCENGGNCTAPNTCTCPTTSQGPGCRQLTCSYLRPCYPGNCKQAVGDQTCDCEPGFYSSRVEDGCINFNETHDELRPEVGFSRVTLANIVRQFNRTNFNFVLESSNNSSKEIIWSNQRRFNTLKFEFEALFLVPENLPERPLYVHSSKLGVVESVIEANHTKIPRDGGLIRDPGSFNIYTCNSGFSPDQPAVEKAFCEIDDDQFTTSIEPGDWLTIKFKSTSGGFQRLTNLDSVPVSYYGTKYYNGLQDIKTAEFRFDFHAPKHCSEPDAYDSCTFGETPLSVAEDITRMPINATCYGWTDDLSGLWQYYMEIFKLGLNSDGRLEELSPIDPVFNVTVDHPENNGVIFFPAYTPSEPGMYSVLMEARDKSNNSRTARRLVLYDNSSSISLNGNDRLYASSAVAETDFKWQTSAGSSDTVEISVNWENHFVNVVHETEGLLKTVEPYPIQFADIEADGILYSKKYVSSELDDHGGRRTLQPIANVRGIVGFSVAYVYTLSESEPKTGWVPLDDLSETTAKTHHLNSGSQVRIWIRARDMMGNTRTDSTLVRIDSTPPVTQQDQSFPVSINVENGPFNYSSRIAFAASDGESGVYKYRYDVIALVNGQERIMYTNYSESSQAYENKSTNPFCQMVDDVCFLPSQTLYIDNCWLTVNKDDLDNATAKVRITAYNQAMLTNALEIQIGRINELHGLEKYNGPQNIRIAQKTSNGFRVTWDLPGQESCYGRADIIIILTTRDGDGEVVLETYYTSGSSRYFDILGLDPNVEYGLGLQIRPQGGQPQDTGMSLAVKTEVPDETSGVSVGVVVGTAVGVIAIVALIAIVLVVLIRKGVIKPPERARELGRRMTRHVRESRLFSKRPFSGGAMDNMAYKFDNNEDEELYLYGGAQSWHISRNDITFESQLTQGRFALIYKSTYKGQTVVAKTLKMNYSAEDQTLMSSKIRFASEKVGAHPNVLKYIGAVVDDETLGPFMVLEFCENGTLKDFLTANRDNVTAEIRENLFRFGLDICKGMEYLASKRIVHRRLAARNILLTFLHEVKITGFGPQSSEDDGDGDPAARKKERIPMKWAAPECMSSMKHATERSDVWSYGVVLWEIFSLGETPYKEGRDRELPDRIKAGERLARPEHCDDTWYETMKQCWAYQAKKRPKFAAIRAELDTMFVASGTDDYYYYKR